MHYWCRSIEHLLFILFLFHISLINAMQPPRIGMTFGRRFGPSFITKQTALQKKQTPAQQALQPRVSGRAMRNSMPLTTTKVVTDIDDTVKSSGGVKLFGIPVSTALHTPHISPAHDSSLSFPNHSSEASTPSSKGESSIQGDSSSSSSCQSRRQSWHLL